MWIVFALLSALTKGTGNVFNKAGADRVDATVLTWLIRMLGAVPWALAVALIPNQANNFTLQFFIAIVVVGALNAFASVARFDAFKQGDVSHLIPLGNLVPVVATVVAFIFLNEQPSMLGVLGVIVIAIGAYALNVNERHVHWTEPFKDLWTAPASRKYMLVVSFLGVSVVIDRYGVDFVSIYVWGLAIVLTQALALTPAVWRKRSLIAPALKKHSPIIFSMTLFSFAAFVFQLLSFTSGGLVGLSLALKRLDSLVTIVLAGRFLGEADTIKRLFSAAIMAFGAVLIGLS